MIIGFYLQNSNIANVDCSIPLDGNPGIGGTEYLFVATTFALSEYSRNNDCEFEFKLIANSPCNLPPNLDIIEACDDNICEIAQKKHIDVLVVRYSPENHRIFKRQNITFRLIMWAHNFVKRSELTLLDQDKNVAAIVCVGNEQLNIYRDHHAYYKSVVIFNGYPISTFGKKYKNSLQPFTTRGHEVTYLGSLVDFKGFHILAKAWRYVVTAVPDAHLNVIGGGKLYDRNQKLGSYGLAEESYENTFIKYIVDEKGKILPSVTFHGVLGHEKNSILNKTKVGIPNPSGVSETFCIAALELQLWGSIITTINYGGFKDTVFESGILYDDYRDLADCIIKQLKCDDNRYIDFFEFAKKFDFNNIINSWLLLFSKLKLGKQIGNELKPPLTKRYKRHEQNRKIKKLLPLGQYLPTIMFYNSVLHRITKRLK